MIEPGQYVKVVFRNGTQMEGIVESWTDKQSVLKSGDQNSLMVIFRTSEDVMAVKVILNFNIPAQAPRRLTELEEEFEVVRAGPSNDSLRLKKLSELRIQLAEQEKEIISNKLTEHLPSQLPSRSNYGIPNINPKFRSKQYPAKKSQR